MDKKKVSIGVKIHDIHHGLIQRTGALVETEFDVLKTLGAAIQIATTIKDHEIIDDLKPFYAASGELKIQRALAKEALIHLEKLGFVRLKYSGIQKNIKRIDVIVPDLEKTYHDFGDYFESENNSELSSKTVEILDKLSAFPHKEKDIVSSLGINPTQYAQIKDVARGASLIDSYTSPKDSESVLYSPLYWEDRPDQIFELLKSYSSTELLKSIDQIKEYQGLPDQKIIDGTALADGIRLGCLPTLSVNSTTGLKKFVFTPKQGVGQIEKNLLHKARVLISCVRYGENFAGITKIIDPRRLINALVNRGYLRPHSESLKQYEPARNIGLVKIIPAYSNRYEVHFIDNDENKLVVAMAQEMLQVGDTSRFDDSEEMAKKILLPGHIMHPTQTRIYSINEQSSERSEQTIVAINELIRGVN